MNVARTYINRIRYLEFNKNDFTLKTPFFLEKEKKNDFSIFLDIIIVAMIFLIRLNFNYVVSNII